MRYARVAGVGIAILVVLAAVGCGGGSSSSGTSTLTPPPSSNVSVAVSPANSTVGYGGSQQFTATVTGSTNTAVTWSVLRANGGSSSQVGTISTSGLYSAPAATNVPAEVTPQLVSVTAGNTSSSVNVAVPPLNSTASVTVTATSQADASKSASATVTLSGLSIIALGQCVQSTTDPTKLNCTAGSTGTEISRSQSGGQNLYIFVAGYGILPGTTYSISGSDVVVTQPPDGNFQPANNGIPTVFFQIVVLSTAALGPRNLIVRNSGNELASFAGAVALRQ